MVQIFFIISSLVLLLTLIQNGCSISYRCENNQVLIVQNFGNDTIRMHCQKLNLCGNINTKCNYSTDQLSCGGRNNFVSNVNQASPTANVLHTCCELRRKEIGEEDNAFIPGHIGNDCFIYELPDGTNTSITDSASNTRKIDGSNVASSLDDFIIFKSTDDKPIKNGYGYRMRLYLLKNKSPPSLVVKAIERERTGYRVTICRPRCEKFNKEDEVAVAVKPSNWAAASWTSWSSSSWSSWSGSSKANKKNRTREYNKFHKKEKEAHMGDLTEDEGDFGPQAEAFAAANASTGTKTGNNGSKKVGDYTPGLGPIINNNIFNLTTNGGSSEGGSNNNVGTKGIEAITPKKANEKEKEGDISDASGLGKTGKKGKGQNLINPDDDDDSSSSNESMKRKRNKKKKKISKLGRKHANKSDSDASDEQSPSESEEAESGDHSGDKGRHHKKPTTAERGRKKGHLQEHGSNGQESKSSGKSSEFGVPNATSGAKNKNSGGEESSNEIKKESNGNNLPTNGSENENSATNDNNLIVSSTPFTDNLRSHKNDKKKGNQTLDKVPDEESILSNKTGDRNSEVSTSLIDSNNHSNGENSNEKASKKKEFDGADKGGEDTNKVEKDDADRLNLTSSSEIITNQPSSNGSGSGVASKKARKGGIDETSKAVTDANENLSLIKSSDEKVNGQTESYDKLDHGEDGLIRVTSGNSKISTTPAESITTGGGGGDSSEEIDATTMMIHSTMSTIATTTGGDSSEEIDASTKMIHSTPSTIAATTTTAAATTATPATAVPPATNTNNKNAMVENKPNNKNEGAKPGVVKQSDAKPGGTPKLENKDGSGSQSGGSNKAQDDTPSSPQNGSPACFSADTIVRTSGGTKRMDELETGDMVLVPTSDNTLGYERIEIFYHREPETYVKFIRIETESNKHLSLTPLHLLPFGECEELSSKTWNNDDVQEFLQQSRFAHKARAGHCLLIIDNDNIIIDRIKKIGRHYSKGIYSPVTTSGSIITNDMLSSCFSQVESHSIQKLAFDLFLSMYRAFGFLTDNADESVQEVPSLLNYIRLLGANILPFSY